MTPSLADYGTDTRTSLTCPDIDKQSMNCR